MEFIKSVAKTVAIIFTVLFVIAIIIGMATPSEEEVNTYVDDLQTQVAKDFENQYQLAKVHGSAMDRCVRAGFVAEGYVQAGDEGLYQKWKEIERDDCRAAGITK